jgi:transposase
MSVNPQGREAVAAARPNAGIDVAKEHLDAAWADRTERVRNDAGGWDALTAKLQADGVDVVAVEASGGYEKGVACALQLAGLAVVVLNARQARDFAKAMGQLAKTDQVDAQVLKQFAAVIARHPQRERYMRPLPETKRRYLAALVMRRRQLLDMHRAESNRLELAHEAAKPSLRAVLRALDKQLSTVDHDIDQYLRQHFKDVAKLLDSVKGVGDVTISTMIALLGELGQLPRRPIAKLVGVAPLACDSGQRRGARSTWGGRTEVRSVLYMATLSAMTHNRVIREFHERLIARGKPPKVAIVACMRKLLTILNAMMRDGAAWDDSKHPQKA